MYTVGVYSIAEGKQLMYDIINTIVLVTKPECLWLLCIA